MVKDSPGRGSRSFIHGSFMRVRRTVFGTTAAASERELYGCRGFCQFCRPPKLPAFSRSWDQRLERLSQCRRGQKQRPTTAKRCSSGTGRPFFFRYWPPGAEGSKSSDLPPSINHVPCAKLCRHSPSSYAPSKLRTFNSPSTCPLASTAALPFPFLSSTSV